MKRGLNRAAILSALTAWLLCASGAMAETAPAELAQAELAQTLDQRLTAPVTINGQGPFQFLIDTSADGTLISTELAQALNLKDAGRRRLHALKGTRDARAVSIDALTIAGKTMQRIKAPALPKADIGADGVIGIDSLRGLRIDIDFQSGAMNVLPGGKDTRPPLADGEILVTAKSRQGQLVMADADANGQKVWVVIDTGGRNSIGNPKLRRLLARSPQATLQPIVLRDVLGDATQADYTIVQRLRIGGILMQGAAIAFADARPFKEFDLDDRPSLLFGMDGLSYFRRVSIDFSARTVRFLPPAGTPSIN